MTLVFDGNIFGGLSLFVGMLFYLLWFFIFVITVKQDMAIYGEPRHGGVFLKIGLILIGVGLVITLGPAGILSILLSILSSIVHAFGK